MDFYQSDETTETYLVYFGLEISHKRKRIFTNNIKVLIQLLIAGMGFEH